MYHKSDSLKPRKEAAEIGIDEYCDGDDGVKDQRAMPRLGFVVWIIDLHEAENDGRIDPGHGGAGGLPGDDENPASCVTEEI